MGWIGMTRWVQIWVRLGPQGPNLGQVELGWPGHQFGSNLGQVGKVHLAALVTSTQQMYSFKL